MPPEHRQLRVGRQAVLGAQLVERLGHDVGRDHRSRRVHEHGRVRQVEQLRGEQAAVVHLVAHDDVRPPVLEDGRRPADAITGVAANEALPDVAPLALEVDLEQRQALRGARPRVGAERERPQAGVCDRSQLAVAAGDGDVVARRRCGVHDRQERLEVAVAAGEREQDAHVSRRARRASSRRTWVSALPRRARLRLRRSASRWRRTGAGAGSRSRRRGCSSCRSPRSARAIPSSRRSASPPTVTIRSGRRSSSSQSSQNWQSSCSRRRRRPVAAIRWPGARGSSA